MEYLNAITPYLTTDNAIAFFTILGALGFGGPKVLFWKGVVVEIAEYLNELPADNELLIKDLESKGKAKMAQALKQNFGKDNISIT